ncbi:MAG: iron-containing alcohol dehydrogenase [Chloroflexi bacterium]|nr:iron-containing alcohol dehydrogenase [Chloroflexota bacterium]MDA1147930.1 iron-containing alcohol dehydrogenase [Chloroflexota bacterium]
MSDQAGSATHAFGARSYEWRLHSAEDAIEQQLATEVARAPRASDRGEIGAKRAFVIASPSIAARTSTVDRIAETLGDRYAGAFGGIEVDSTYRSVAAAADAAREAGADLLIAVGGGSVIVAARVADVFLCEDGDPFDLMTQYPEGKPAFSPRLMAPKLPIINIPTTPTSAMNRAGSGLANPDLEHRMEYFDPKTRPTSIFWDWQALRATPLEVMRSTATTTFAGAVSAAAAPEANPLVEGDRAQILRLARRAYPRLIAEPEAIEPRIDLCAAALLQNRSADDDASGGVGTRDEVFGGDYAISTALHVLYAEVGQGESTSVLQATVARRAADPDADASRRVAELLEVWRDGMSASQATLAAADAIEATYRAAGMPVRIRDLDVPREDFARIAEATLKNFNANQGTRSEDERRHQTIALLEACW